MNHHSKNRELNQVELKNKQQKTNCIMAIINLYI